MHSVKKKRLKSKGWKIGNTQEFLNLSPEEAAHVEAKLVLGEVRQGSANGRA